MKTILFILILSTVIYSQDTCKHISDGSRILDVDSYKRIYENYEDSTIMYERFEYYTQCIKCKVFYKIDIKQIRTVIWRRDN